MHWNPLLPFGEYIDNEVSWQDADGPQDCILVVSDDGMPGTEVMSTDPKPVDEGDAICVQRVQTGKKAKLFGSSLMGMDKISILAQIM